MTEHETERWHLSDAWDGVCIVLLIMVGLIISPIGIFKALTGRA